MADGLTPPFLMSAALLVLAGAAKLRAPGPAARALIVLGAPPRQRPLIALVRVGALAELCLGLAAAIQPSPGVAVAVAVLFAGFGTLSVGLARRRAACGCFGASEAPTTPVHTTVCAALAGVALVAAVRPPHGLGWLAAHAAPAGAVALAGVIAATYGVALILRDLPQAWGAWRGG